MRDISPFTGPMSDHTKDRLKNAINPMNINQDPFIKNDPFVQQDLENWVPGYQRPKTGFNTNNRNIQIHNPASIGDAIGAMVIILGVLGGAAFVVIASLIIMQFKPEIIIALDVAAAFTFWFVEQVQVINNVPMILFITTIAHFIVVKLYKTTK